MIMMFLLNSGIYFPNCLQRSRVSPLGENKRGEFPKINIHRDWFLEEI